MYEYIISFFKLNESIALFSVKPLYYSVLHVLNPPKFFHEIRVNTKNVSEYKKRVNPRRSWDHTCTFYREVTLFHDSIQLLCLILLYVNYKWSQEVAGNLR